MNVIECSDRKLLTKPEVVLSIDRFVLIAPFKCFQSLKNIRNSSFYVPVVTATVWSLAFTLTIPTLVHSNYNEDGQFCLQSWPEPEYK